MGEIGSYSSATGLAVDGGPERPSRTASGVPARRRGWKCVLPGLLLVHCALLVWSAVRDSPTWDEPARLAAGIAHWKLRRFGLYRPNPPLVRMVAALPVLPWRPKMDWRVYGEGPGSRAEFPLGKQFVRDNRERFVLYHVLARLATIPFALVGMLVCLRWASELYGRSAGVVAVTLWCFSPSILGYGHLISPDTAAASLGLAAAYGFWRWLRQPSTFRALFAGALLGLAWLSKLTWLVLLALWPAIWAVAACSRSGRKVSRQVLAETLQLGLVILAGLWLLNACYFFDGTFTRLGEYEFVSNALGRHAGSSGHCSGVGNRFAGTWLGCLPMPLPKDYVMGADVQKHDFERKMSSYLCGQWKAGGWWYYYIYALLIKVPLGTWALVSLAAWLVLVTKRYVVSWFDELVLVAPALAVLILVSSQTGFNHHIRYVLPMLGFVFVWTSKVGRAMELGRHKLAMLVAGATVWSVASSLWIYPHSLSYFNEWVGGPRNGHAHLLHSNTDWGQDMLHLKRWLDKHPGAQPIGVAWYVPVMDPKYFGIEWTAPPRGLPARGMTMPDPESVGPLPGWFAISVNRIRAIDGMYRYFLRFEPVAMAGYSMYIYHITLEEANRVRRELGLPELAERGAGRGESQE
ncbi:MAG TPA: hypothetical protein EYH34_07185, partial [Planctomycetes bacterium]|nr:hypothetical protein [Planctomycetota bacterium]